MQGKAGIQVYESEKPDAKPITAPYELEGNFKFVATPWRKPYLTITADPATQIRTVSGGVAGRLDGAGLTDEGDTLIIRTRPGAAASAPADPCTPPGVRP